MVGIVVIVVVVVALVLFAMRFAAGARLSRDPHQGELASLLVRAVQRPIAGSMKQDDNGRWVHANGAPFNAIEGFRDATRYLSTHFSGETPGQRKLRLLHALTLAQRQVSPSDYDFLRIEVAHYRG